MESYSLSFELFSNVFQKHAPLRKKRVKRWYHWMNNGILYASKQRNHFHKRETTAGLKFGDKM